MTGTAVATRGPSAFEVELTDYEPQLLAALPDHLKERVDKFKRVVVTAVSRNPDLLKADRRSLFNACVSSANDGLYPDGSEAALVIFGDKVQYMPMIAGVRKKMRNSKDVLSADAYVVYEKDKYSYVLGDNAAIVHEPPPLGGDRGKPLGAYAIIKLTNGEILREVMSVSEIEKVRAISRSKNGPAWSGWWEQMARKTVLRRCAKGAPSSADVEELYKREEADYPPLPTPPRPTRQDPVELPPAATVDDDGVVRQYADEGPQAESENPNPNPEPDSPIGKKGKEWDKALEGWSVWLRNELPTLPTPEARQALLDARPKEWADLMQFRRSEADAALALIRPWANATAPAPAAPQAIGRSKANMDRGTRRGSCRAFTSRNLRRKPRCHAMCGCRQRRCCIGLGDPVREDRHERGKHERDEANAGAVREVPVDARAHPAHCEGGGETRRLVLLPRPHGHLHGGGDCRGQTASQIRPRRPREGP